MPVWKCRTRYRHCGLAPAGQVCRFSGQARPPPKSAIGRPLRASNFRAQGHSRPRGHASVRTLRATRPRRRGRALQAPYRRRIAGMHELRRRGRGSPAQLCETCIPAQCTNRAAAGDVAGCGRAGSCRRMSPATENGTGSEDVDSRWRKACPDLTRGTAHVSAWRSTRSAPTPWRSCAAAARVSAGVPGRRFRVLPALSGGYRVLDAPDRNPYSICPDTTRPWKGHHEHRNRT